MLNLHTPSRTLDHIQYGEPVALIYEKQDDLDDVIIPLLDAGFQNGEHCSYITTVDALDAARCLLDSLYPAPSRLSCIGIDPAKQPVFHEIVRILTQECQLALYRTPRTTRIICDMNHLLSRTERSEDFLEGAAQLLKLQLPNCILLFHYHRSSTNPDIVKWIVMTHPSIIWGHRFYHGIHYIPSQEHLKQDHREYEIQVLLNRIEQESINKENVRFFATLVEHASQPVAVCLDNGSLLTCNAAFCNLTGYSLEELRLLSWMTDLTPSRWREAEQHLMARLIGTGTPIRYEKEFLRKDRTSVPVELLTHMVLDSNGNPLYFYAFVTDITERKTAEANLRLWASVIETVSEGIIVYDRNWSVRSANPAFTAITGYNAEDFAEPQSVAQVLKLAQQDALSIRQALLAGGQWSGQVNSFRKNEESYIAEISAFAIPDGNGRPDYFVAVIRDVTEREKIREEQQVLQQKLATADRLALLSTLTAGVVHEISQPLNAIKMLADGMLFWQRQGKMPDGIRLTDKLTRISNQANRINDIIHHMRAFAHSGDMSIQPCCLNQAVTGAFKLVSTQLTNHGILLEDDLQPELLPVFANLNRLEEIVINLLVNAMHALDDASCETKLVRCRTWNEDAHVCLEVIDNATGIDPRLGRQIFEPFFTTKSDHEGSGLGLAIVHSQITGYGGIVDYCNNDLGGATFLIRLPAIPNSIVGGADHSHIAG